MRHFAQRCGGNNPRATTDKEYYEPGDLDAETKSFFDLEQKGVEFVFNLNFLGTLIPTQAFAKDMLGRDGCNILNISSMNAYTPLTKIPAYSGAKAAISNFTQWLAVHFSKMGIRVNAIAPGFFSTKQNAALLWNADGTPTARTGKILAATPMDASARRRNWSAQFCSCSITTPHPSLPALSCPSTAASLRIPASDSSQRPATSFPAGRKFIIWRILWNCFYTKRIKTA